MEQIFLYVYLVKSLTWRVCQKELFKVIPLYRNDFYVELIKQAPTFLLEGISYGEFLAVTSLPTPVSNFQQKQEDSLTSL